MRSIIFASTIIIFIISCNKSGLNGKIEKRQPCGEVRGAQVIYLVNSSKKKSFVFTVKETQYLNDTISDYNTYRIELSPGDEKLLGCSGRLQMDTQGLVTEVPVKIDTVIKMPNNKKIKVTNGKENYEIYEQDLKNAINDGFRRVDNIKNTNNPFDDVDNFCTIDTNVLKYRFLKLFLLDKNVLSLDNVSEEAKAQGISLSEYIVIRKIFLILPNKSLTFSKDSLSAKLKCIDPAPIITKYAYRYVYEVTGEVEVIPKAAKK